MKQIIAKKLLDGYMEVTKFLNTVTPETTTESGGGNADDIINQILTPMNAIITVIVAGMSIVGTIMVVKAVTELANAIQEHDNSGIFRAGRALLAALLIAATGVLIGLFGYKV